jgi:hypothetical protein
MFGATRLVRVRSPTSTTLRTISRATPAQGEVLRTLRGLATGTRSSRAGAFDAATSRVCPAVTRGGPSRGRRRGRLMEATKARPAVGKGGLYGNVLRIAADERHRHRDGKRNEIPRAAADEIMADV